MKPSHGFHLFFYFRASTVHSPLPRGWFYIYMCVHLLRRARASLPRTRTRVRARPTYGYNVRTADREIDAVVVLNTGRAKI